MNHEHELNSAEKRRTELERGAGLEALAPLDLRKVRGFSDLTRAMSRTSFGGRQLGEAADILYEMAADKDCYVVLTVSGAMTMAKMGLVICDMIDEGMVDAMVCTGALMAHGLVEGAGMTHFKHKPSMEDAELYLKGYNRVYDTIELEANLDDAELIVQEALSSLDLSKPVGSYKINEAIGKLLKEKGAGRAILKSAHEKNIPVYVPAFTDSELGLDAAIFNKERKPGEERLKFEPFEDLDHYTENVRKAKKLGIFTIGGGVPRNWAQQVGPYLDILEKRLGKGHGGFKRFHYAVRICPEPVHWGGLSGCTYSEGVSWGKFVPEGEGGKWAEVHSDATIAWPLIVKSVMERMEDEKTRKTTS